MNKVMTGAIATLSRKFRISISKAVRDWRRWELGQESACISKGHEDLLMPVSDIDQLWGIVKDADPAGRRECRG